MRDLLDLGGRWLVRPGRRGGLPPGQIGLPPSAVDDSLTVFRGQGPIVVPVLANDGDPDGVTLTLVSASAALGQATANPDGTVTYTAPQGTPPGAVAFDTVVYEIADADDNRDTGQIDITITEPVLSVDVTPENTLTVTAGPDPIEITLTDPVGFAGSYQTDLADLLVGPVSLVPPAISGTIAAGEVLSATDGLWIHDLAAEPVAQSWQWQRGGMDIAGATGAAYVLQSADLGSGITVAETKSDSYGARTAISAAVAMGFQPGADNALIGWWDADDAATLTEDGSGGVDGWTDKAGGAALIQTNAARAPRTGLRQLGGRNVLDFRGTDFLEAARALPGSGDVAFHMALVIDGTVNAFEAVLSVDSTNDFQIDSNNADAFDGRLNLAGSGAPVSLSGGPFAGAMILSAIFDRTGAGTAEIHIADTLRGTTAYTQSLDASQMLRLMTNRSANAWVDGAVAEIIVTGDVANRADHHGYLASKWGLS